MMKMRALLWLALIGLLGSESHAQSMWKIKHSEDGTIDILTESSTVGAQIAVTGFPNLKRTSSSVDCASGDKNSFCRDWGSMKLKAILNDPKCVQTEVTLNEGEDVDGDSHYVFKSRYTGHLFGGAEQRHQDWPLDDVEYNHYEYITKEDDSAAIAERYWFTSSGRIYYVPPEVPLFIDHNPADHSLNFHCENREPYPSPRPFICGVTMCQLENAREAHLFAIEKFLGKPNDIPDERMVRHPIWSTWARYKRDIDEDTVLEFAGKIIEHGFNNSQLEVDDLWETCYGSLTFNTTKFPNMTKLSETLQEKGFRVTLWVHPFINTDNPECTDLLKFARDRGYLAKNETGDETSWWNSEPGKATVIDFTNPAAANWWADRLRTMMTENGIDSLKFDGGETSWAPRVSNFSSDVDIKLQPNIYTQKFVETVIKFGKIAEIRTGFETQMYPNFVRMIDKDTNWGFENGLHTLVTTLLQMNLAGYPFVLPDMVGGNGYGDEGIGSGGTQNAPDKELYIRWLQANVFMPSIQYSFLPWEYDEETVKICLYYTELHAEYADKIIQAMKNAVRTGTPVNPPIWWIDPTDENALTINDEFLLGEDLLVAPMLENGTTGRDIYLPRGVWQDKLRNTRIDGPVWLRNYTVALDELPYFEYLGLAGAPSQHTVQAFCLLLCLLAAISNFW